MKNLKEKKFYARQVPMYSWIFWIVSIVLKLKIKATQITKITYMSLSIHSHRHTLKHILKSMPITLHQQQINCFTTLVFFSPFFILFCFKLCVSVFLCLLLICWPFVGCRWINCCFCCRSCCFY